MSQPTYRHNLAARPHEPPAQVELVSLPRLEHGHPEPNAAARPRAELIPPTANYVLERTST